MPPTVLTYSETLVFPNLAEACARAGLEEVRVGSVRKALAEVKRRAPRVVLAEFVSAWGNNYSSCHIGNLDTLLIALPKYAPAARVIVVAQRAELEHAQRLRGHHPFAALLTPPLDLEELAALLAGAPLPNG